MREASTSDAHPAVGASASGQSGNGRVNAIGESVVLSARMAGCHYLVSCLELEYRFHRLVVQAPGTKIMHGFAVLSRFFYAIGDRSGIDLNKLIAVFLARGFFKLSHFVFEVVYASQQRALALNSLRGLLLLGKYMSPGVYELSVKFLGGRNDLSFIERLYGRLEARDCHADASQKGWDAHRNLPVVDEVGSATDSTARGIGESHA